MKNFLYVVLISLTLAMCSSANPRDSGWYEQRTNQEDLQGLSKAYFASGCFWCVEAVYESVEGVKEVISGYAGGPESNPTYSQISAGSTGHAEAVEVFYDPSIVDFRTLVKVFYGSQDPTTVNGQHPDYGTQYRSIIFFANQEEKQIAEDEKAALGASGAYSKPIATEIKMLEKFWPAEDYHQDYERLNPNQSYVQSVSIPRLNRFKARFPDLLKKGE
jgi:peptide-methionine (S)-S-oxide reductase